MTGWQYTKGLHEIGNGGYAWLQPDGGWGWSNAGLVTDGDQAMLVDTLFDVHLTQDMLDAMNDATPAASNIDTLINTHANGDHTHGNGLLPDAEIVSSKASAAEMTDPERLAAMMAGADNLGPGGQYLKKSFEAFDFEIEGWRAPTRTFSHRLSLKVGDKDVELIEVGPAHTKGDILVHVPSDRTLYSGDILFIDGTPIIWDGPVSNWTRACDLMCDLDLEVIVPGHGPITDKDGVQAVKGYLEYIEAETRKRFDADLSLEDAIFDIALGDYESWGDAERIAINVNTLYREYGYDGGETAPLYIWALMGRVKRDKLGT